jgi:hypothetical protein
MKRDTIQIDSDNDTLIIDKAAITAVRKRNGLTVIYFDGNYVYVNCDFDKLLSMLTERKTSKPKQRRK